VNRPLESGVHRVSVNWLPSLDHWMHANRLGWLARATGVCALNNRRSRAR